jgi:tetratricopeptide (TPR) repeat protein
MESNENSKDGHGNGREGPIEAQNKQGGQSDQQAPLWRVLLYSAAIALVCSIVGAGTTMYLFGISDRSSSDENSPGNRSSKGGSRPAGSSTGASNVGSSSKIESTASGDSGAGQDSISSPNSEPGTSPSRAGSNTPKILEAESAWLIAVRELHEAQVAEKASRQAAADSKLILEFLKATLLSAGRPGGVSLSEAFWAGGKGKDLTLRKSLDATDARVAEAFDGRPLAEATVRELLGQAYLNLGEATVAVKEYERAFALRQAIEGAHHPETAVCRNQLAVAYRLAGHADKGGRLFDTDPNSTSEAAALSLDGSMLLEQNKAADAELKLRRSLAMRQKSQPDDWSTFDTESSLGEALLHQTKYGEAEPLLLSGYEGLRLREGTIPSQDKPRLSKALERIVKLYEAWGKQDEAARWRKLVAPTTRISPPSVQNTVIRTNDPSR